MKKVIKKVIVGFVTTALIATTTICSYAQSSSDFLVESELSDAYEFLSAMLVLDEQLGTLGMTWEDMDEINQIDASVIEELKDIVSEEGKDVETLLATPDEASATITDQARAEAMAICKSYYLAEVNLNNRGSSGDIIKEAQYMFMSHYVDVPGSTKSDLLTTSSLVNLSQDPIETATWLTSYDRQAYDTYINRITGSARVFYLSSAFAEIYAIKEGFKKPDSEISSAKEVSSQLDYMINNKPVEFTTFAMDIGTVISDMCNGLKNYNSISDICDMILQNYTDSSNAEDVWQVISYGVAIMHIVNGNPIPLMIGLALDTTTTTIGRSTNIYNNAIWAALVRSRSSRISYRYMWYYGML